MDVLESYGKGQEGVYAFLDVEELGLLVDVADEDEEYFLLELVFSVEVGVGFGVVTTTVLNTVTVTVWSLVPL